MDDGWLTNVPASRTDRDPETNLLAQEMFPHDKELFKIQALDQTLKGPETVGQLGGVKRAFLDGRVLEFRNDNRQRKRYLWFTAIMSIARRHRAEVAGWHDDVTVLGTRTWALLGEYTRTANMRQIMRTIGLVNDDQAEAVMELGPSAAVHTLDDAEIDRNIADRAALYALPLQGKCQRKHSKDVKILMRRIGTSPFPRAQLSHDDDNDEDDDEDEEGATPTPGSRVLCQPVINTTGWRATVRFVGTPMFLRRTPRSHVLFQQNS
jgi:hypothetical protein